METMHRLRERQSDIDVNTASASSRSGLSSRRSSEAPKVVIGQNPHDLSGEAPVLFTGSGMRISTLSVRTLNYTGAAALLDLEL